MREKQELLKREGERERDASSLSIYTRWGGVIRDDGNIKSGECAMFEMWKECDINLRKQENLRRKL